MAEAINIQLNITSEAVFQQQQNVALIAEMYHTASLYHDDVIDKAELRRSKPSVNYLWVCTNFTKKRLKKNTFLFIF